jgi:hypothetical protein
MQPVPIDREALGLHATFAHTDSGYSIHAAKRWSTP